MVVVVEVRLELDELLADVDVDDDVEVVVVGTVELVLAVVEVREVLLEEVVLVDVVEVDELLDDVDVEVLVDTVELVLVDVLVVLDVLDDVVLVGPPPPTTARFMSVTISPAVSARL